LAVGVGASGPVAGQTVVPEEYAARSISRVAFMDLRARPNPTPDDYLVADHVLAAALAFAPDDAELVRARIAAAWSAGDAAGVDAMTVRLLGLDPGDTVAQLRLASSRISKLQTVEERLAAYSRLLGPAGASIDPSVRSRLALDAALLVRESGDSAGFAERLTQAMQLDSTNKEAAALAWSYFGPLLASRPERIELLLNLLMADPIDPNVYHQLAIELSLAGAFEEAQRFHTLALGLYQVEGSPSHERLVTEDAVIRWQVAGPRAVVDALNQQLAGMRQEAATRIQQYEQARMPTETLIKPEEIVLAPAYNQIRLVAAIMIEDRATIEGALADTARLFQETLRAASETSRLSSPEERVRKHAEIWGEIAQQLSTIAWADMQTEALDEWTGRAVETFGADAPVSVMLRAWRELRLGDPQRAVELFRASTIDSPINRVGLGLGLEATGGAEEALGVYGELAREHPMSLSGVWARDRHRAMTGRDPVATPERAAAAALARGVPGWVDRMATEPRSFMMLGAEAVSGTLGATERTELRLRLNSRLLLSPRLQVGANTELGSMQPEVVEFNRRLRLNPTESIDVIFQPDVGVAGWQSEVGAIETVRQRWRVMQGYRLDSRGSPVPGNLCLETDTHSVVRTPLEWGKVPAVELADAFEAVGPDGLPSVVAAVRARALVAPGGAYGLTRDDLERLAGIAADRYPDLPAVSRAMMLAVLPNARVAPGMEAFDAAALAERDPSLAPVALVTRVTDPHDAVLAGWLESEEDGLGAFARALRGRLESGEATFSRLDAAALRVGGSAR
jgi:tetratricopeptide (TPR) repeat protein